MHTNYFILAFLLFHKPLVENVMQSFDAEQFLINCVCVSLFGSNSGVVCRTEAPEEGTIDSVRGGGHQGEYYHL